MLNAGDYRSVLKEILTDRVKKNPSYSLRAFAAQLGIAPSMLSGIFRGTKNLSVPTAYDVAQKLGFSAETTDVFCLLVQLAATKSVSQKESLLARIHALQPQLKTRDLSLDVFKSIADWAHATTLVLLELKNMPETTVAAVARRLGVSGVEADLILERLERLELVRKDDLGNYEKTTDEHLMGRSAVANQALREFHRSMLERATESLATQSPQEKFVGSETVVFDPKKLPEVNAALEECFTKIKNIAASGSSQSEVYHLGMQFFRLTQPVSTEQKTVQKQNPKSPKRAPEKTK